MKNLNILFTSVGRRVSLIEHFKQAFYNLKIPGHIIAADMQQNAPGLFVGDSKELVPRVNDPNYIDRLIEICRNHCIRLLIPLIDTELSILAHYKRDFAANGVTVLVSSLEVTEICFDKRSTYNFFKSIGVGTPELYNPYRVLADAKMKYPLFLKPVNGSCSIGATKIENSRELEFFMDYIPNAIVQEYISGEEYTLDVLVDLNGKVRSVVPRLRIETRAGEVSKGITVKDAAIIAAGKKVVEALPGVVGCITVQCFKTLNGEIKFIEINPRFGGGIPLSIHAGADFPRWVIEMIMGIDSEFAIDDWKDGVVMLRYDSEIFAAKNDII